MKHVSMMHACVMHVKNGDGQTNEQTNERTDGKLNSRSRIYLASSLARRRQGAIAKQDFEKTPKCTKLYTA